MTIHPNLGNPRTDGPFDIEHTSDETVPLLSAEGEENAVITTLAETAITEGNSEKKARPHTFFPLNSHMSSEISSVAEQTLPHHPPSRLSQVLSFFGSLVGSIQVPVTITGYTGDAKTAEAICPTITQQFVFKGDSTYQELTFTDKSVFQETATSYQNYLSAQGITATREKAWANCNSVRQKAKETTTYQNFTKEVRPIIPNLIVETLSRQDGDDASVTKQTLTRSGAITDPRNGHFSLRDLLKIKKPGSTQITAILNRIDKTEKKAKAGNYYGKKTLNQKQIEALAYARDKLVPKKIDELIKEREDFLIPQFLQLFEASFKSNFRGADKFLLVQTSLLNTKAEFNTDGLMVNEQTQAEDMDAIFEKFHGYTITFNTDETIKGSCVDQDKKTICLPSSMKPQADQNYQDIKLSTAFFNISVQKDVSYEETNKKDPSSDSFKQINDRNLERLNAFDMHKSITSIFVGKPPTNKTSYLVTEDFISVLQKTHSENCGIGLNCFSGKDRTGFVVARLIQNYISKNIGEIKNIYARTVLFFNGMASAVVKINTNLDYLKIEPKFLPDNLLKVSQAIRGLAGLVFQGKAKV